MNVTVRTFAGFRDILGNQLVACVPEGETVRGLLEMLARDHAELGAVLLRDGARLNPQVTVLENGRDIRFLDNLETRLADGDIISLFPLVAGG